MIFECLQEYLNKGLGVVNRAIPVKGSLPVLSNVLITAQNGKVKLTATNLETVITFTFGASVSEEGSVTVPAKMFYEYVSTLDSGKIVVNAKNNILNLTSLPKAKAKFNGMSSVEFPDIPALDSETIQKFEINPKILSNLVSHTYFSSSPDVTRPALTGTLLTIEDGMLSFVTTDGFRLSQKIHNLESETEKLKVLIPTKTLQDVSKIFGTLEENVTLIHKSSDNLMFFSNSDTEIATRVIGSEFPDFKRILPKEKVFTASFKTSDLLNAVKLTSVFSKEATSVIKLEFTNEGIVRVFSNSEDSGENVSEFEAQIEGSELNLGFNSKYLLDLLNNLKFENMVIESNGGTTPVVFKSPEVENYIHLIVPMKI